MKKPDWLTYEANGTATVKLSRPLQIGGAKAETLSMREPTVEDQLTASAGGGSDSDTEMRLMCNLCQLAPEELRKMPLRDYKRVQAAFLGFID